MKIGFQKEKDTKNTIRYKEVTHDGVKISDGDEIISTLYVKKAFANERELIEIEIEIEIPSSATL